MAIASLNHLFEADASCTLIATPLEIVDKHPKMEIVAGGKTDH
jgi:hypothetical protein